MIFVHQLPLLLNISSFGILSKEIENLFAVIQVGAKNVLIGLSVLAVSLN